MSKKKQKKTNKHIVEIVFFDKNYKTLEIITKIKSYITNKKEISLLGRQTQACYTET